MFVMGVWNALGWLLLSVISFTLLYNIFDFFKDTFYKIREKLSKLKKGYTKKGNEYVVYTKREIFNDFLKSDFFKVGIFSFFIFLGVYIYFCLSGQYNPLGEICLWIFWWIVFYFAGKRKEEK